MGVAIRVTCVLVLGACGDAKSSTTAAEAEPAAVVPAPKVEAALAAIVATCAKCDSTEVRRKGKPYWEAVSTGGTFRDGDWIRTGTGSARIRFVSGGHLDLDEKTTLFVEADSAKRAADGKAAGVHVAIQTGGAWGVLDGAKDAPIAIRTNEGEVRIAGTQGAASEFRLKPTTDGAVEVAVSKGELVVKNGANERRIEAEKPEPVTPKVVPRPYVPPPKKDAIAFPSSTAPRVDARFKCMALLEIPLRWAAVNGATQYKVLVARDMSFRSIVSVKELKDTSFTFRPTGPGTYVWRVAARDARGYGEFGFARRIFCDK